MIREQIHPAFLWIWVSLLVTALIRLDESAFSISVIIGLIVLLRSLPSGYVRWSTLNLALRLAILALVIRMFFALLIGVPMPGQVLFQIPQIELPEFLVGIRLGGDVTTSRLASAFGEATLFAALIALFGAANALTTPSKILKVIPRRLYGVGVATALAATLTPQLATSVRRVKQAQFLRGQERSGFRSWRRIGTPVLEDAMAKSLDLAASLEARGYGINQNPTRYRPIKWDVAHSVALLPAAYAALVLPPLNLPISVVAVILLGAVITPLVLK